jgi:hypothetical protein
LTTTIFQDSFIGRWIFVFITLAAFSVFPEASSSADKAPASDHPQPLYLEAPHSLGQTFLSRYRGLDGIEILLFPTQNPQGKVKIHLRENPYSPNDIIQSDLALNQISAPGFYLFPFAPIKDSSAKRYYLLLSGEGKGPVGVGAGPGSGYFDGSLYRDGTPDDRQLAFRLRYDQRGKMLGLFQEGIHWLFLLGLAVWLFVIPGWALLYLWPDRTGLDWAEKLGLSLGLSIALYPVLFLWTDLIGIHLGPGYAWLPPVFGLLTILWLNRFWRPTRLKTGLSSWIHSGQFWPDLTTLLLIGLVFSIRFYVVRILDYPLWGDSFQHTVIAQLLVDHGGLFDSWEPYASLETFTYHFGFHSAVAVYHWLSGLALPQACLWTGQILNGAAVLALIPLARKIGTGRWAGLGPILVAGLLATMPMFYLNWGRYTQLTGQVILPAAVFFLWKLLEAKGFSRKGVFLTSLALAGLALSHYRVAFFALAFIVAFPLLPFSWETVKTTVKRIIPLAVGSGILFFPWFWHVSSGKISKIFSVQVTTPVGQLTTWEKAHNAIGPLTDYLPVSLWLFLAFVIGRGLWTRSQGLALMVLWWCLIVLSANPDWIGLPGTGILNSFAVFIAFYIPVGILAGYFIGQLTEDLYRRFSKNQTALFFCLLFLALGLWGAQERIAEVNRKFSPMVTGPDLQAARWIKEYTSSQDLFLVNSAFGYDNSVVVGMDAGWWLPLSAGRKTNLPPLLYVTEKGPRPDFESWTRTLIEEIQGRGLEHPEIARLLTQRGFTHLYVGQSTGRIQIGAFSLDPNQLGMSPWFKPVYHRDRVWIFSITS